MDSGGLAAIEMPTSQKRATFNPYLTLPMFIGGVHDTKPLQGCPSACFGKNKGRTVDEGKVSAPNAGCEAGRKAD